MHIRDDFIYHTKALSNADYQVITGRIVALLDWMESQPQIKQLIDKLRESGTGKALVAECQFNRPPKAHTNEEIAMVGLELMDLCRDKKMALYNIARNCGIRGYSTGKVSEYSNEAIASYIEPFLNHILRGLPVPESTSLKHESTKLGASIPVAIQESLKSFQADFPDSRKACFIMMQFGDTSAHEGIENGIKAALMKHGITGLLARDKEYHDDLFPNIQTYMHGCGFGIAVFERIKSDDFNPNVSMEVGYLLGLRKLVLLLKDKTLPTLHTDLAGKLYRPFDPLHPEKTIATQLEPWLEDKGLLS